MEYQPDKFNPTDYLSCHPLRHNAKHHKNAKKREHIVKAIVKESIPEAVTLTEVLDAIRSDKTLQKLTGYISSGRFNACKIDPNTKCYSSVLYELSNVNGILLCGQQVVIPHSLQEQVVKISHEGHLGIVLTKQFLRSRVWFPGIDKLVEREVKSCLPCQATTPVSTRTPLVMSELPSKPWEHVAIDFCGPFPTGELALVVVDEYSRYPELEIVTSTSVSTVRPELEKIFAIHGIPDFVKSDNGPPFDRHAFEDYAKEKRFIHKPVTPLWSEANRIVECFMQPLVKSARASSAAGRNWKNEIYTFVANY